MLPESRLTQVVFFYPVHLSVPHKVRCAKNHLQRTRAEGRSDALTIRAQNSGALMFEWFEYTNDLITTSGQPRRMLVVVPGISADDNASLWRIEPNRRESGEVGCEVVPAIVDEVEVVGDARFVTGSTVGRKRLTT